MPPSGTGSSLGGLLITMERFIWRDSPPVVSPQLTRLDVKAKRDQALNTCLDVYLIAGSRQLCSSHEQMKSSVPGRPPSKDSHMPRGRPWRLSCQLPHPARHSPLCHPPSKQ